MLGSNVKTHADIKTMVSNILDISAGLTPEDVITSTEVVSGVLDRMHQLAMFEIEVSKLAKEDHGDAKKKHLYTILNTVNCGISRDNLNARESIMGRYQNFVYHYNDYNEKDIDRAQVELLLYLDPIQNEVTTDSWWSRFVAKFKSKPKAEKTKENKPTQITDQGLTTN